MELNIDPASLQQVVHAAIMDQLGAEGRERLVAAALEHLLTAPQKTNHYGPDIPSPLQLAFNSAASAAAHEIVREEVAKDPVFISKVREAVGAALVQIDSDQFTFYVAEALGEALKRNGGMRS